LWEDLLNIVFARALCLLLFVSPLFHRASCSNS